MHIHKPFVVNTAAAVFLVLGASAAFGQNTSQNTNQNQTQAQQPSLADAARKARAEKKEQPKNAKVFTNDDLDSLKGTINVVGEAPTPPPAQAGAKGAAAQAPSTTEAKDEAYFRQKFADARRTLADDQKELDVLQREFNLKQVQYYSDPNVAMREQNSREDLNNTQAQIDAKKADVAKDQQAISDLEDELRKSGGDPGWANPPATSPAQPQ